MRPKSEIKKPADCHAKQILCRKDNAVRCSVVAALILISYGLVIPPEKKGAEFVLGAIAQEVSDPLADKPSQDLLQGRLSAEEVVATAVVAHDSQSLTLNVENKGRRALIFEVDKANIHTSKSSSSPDNLGNDGSSQSPLVQEQLVSAPAKVNIPGDVLTVVASFGSLGVVPVGIDAVKTERAKPGAYYGKDAERRRLAAKRFARRVVFPGENSHGTVYFDHKIGVNSIISIPVLVHPEGVEIGKLEIVLQQSQTAGR